MTKALSFRNLVLFLACLLVASGAFAFDGMSATFDSATWNVDKAHGSTLTVKGPSGVFVRSEFGPGDTPTFTIWDKAGYALPDGQYNWQLSLNAAKLVRGEDAPGASAESYSGTFRIENGSLLVPRASDRDSDSVTKDQVIADDLIVDGSICVGFDCVNNEAFGFDTIRIKENNTRIKFEDTSSGTFPSNDWQLTANDSASGGANKFSIDDITNARTPFTIEATAPSNSLFVDDTGRVGFGTSTPVLNLHVASGNSPALRLEQNGSSGFTPQTWDLAGNEANFFIRDVTNGSKLPFRIFPNAPSSSLVIDGSGQVGIGAGADPKSKFHVVNGGTPFTPFSGTILLLQNDAATADAALMTLLSGATGNSQLNFGDSTNEFQGRIIYEPTIDRMRLFTASSSRVEIDGSGGVTVSGLAGGAGGAAGNDLCVDAAGKLCRCGSC